MNEQLKVNLSKEIEIIRRVANLALPQTTPGSLEYQTCKRVISYPVEYMRWAEFTVMLKTLDIKPGDRVLDVGSPQWFTILLAYKYPETHFTYINILDDEVAPYGSVAELAGLKNIQHEIGDVRDLEYDDDSFDNVISISVLEHIYPAEGGDVIAFDEIRRVLKSEGSLYLTLPYKSNGEIVYLDEPVYERKELKKNFFAREYDREMFENLLNKTNSSVSERYFICEKKGFLSLDYYEFGPGKSKSGAKVNMLLYRVLKKIWPYSITRFMALRYLFISDSPKDRLVNIGAKLGFENV